MGYLKGGVVRNILEVTSVLCRFGSGMVSCQGNVLQMQSLL